ncbi:MAG: IS1634 family transposase [Chloroflexi bacterium]|nr:IS1634 family transposase [Chloroflexota bacterium]
MTEQLTVMIERVDDIPILIASMDRMGLAELVDEYFAPHGNWQGLSPGKVLTGWLAHILSEADHRLNRVQDWAAKRIETLRGSLGDEVRALDFADDRLAIGLDLLSDDEKWAQFEMALNQRTIRVYDLKPKSVRIDSTTASGYWKVTEDGLFQFGHSKDRRPDLPQVKVVLSTLDPLGMPVVTQVVSGEKADDPLYIPAIDQVREGVGRRGLLYVGDCKLMALETRAHLEVGDDYYLGPFSLTQIPQETLDDYLKPVWDKEQPLTAVYRCGADGKKEQIAEGFERSETLTVMVAGKEETWVEHRLVVRSLQHAKAAEAALRSRLEKAKAAIEALNERKQGRERFTELEPLRQTAEAILKQHEVEGLLVLQYAEQAQERPVRKYGARPAETRVERQVSVAVQRDDAAIQAAVRRLGWRMYGTNCPQNELSLEQAVLAYREEYLVERNFGRLKGKPLTLTPMYLEDDQRATGLIRLLSVGLRVLTLLEHVARRRLAETGEALTGLYAGNPSRATNRPTTEAMLQAFKDIFLSLVTIGEQTYRHLTPLSDLQQQILGLLDFPVSIYTRLSTNSANPP